MQVYPLRFMRMAFRALGNATNTYVRVNEQGLLCVQHTIDHSDSASESVLAFIIFPVDAEFDPSGGGSGGGGGASDDDGEDENGGADDTAQGSGRRREDADDSGANDGGE